MSEHVDLIVIHASELLTARTLNGAPARGHDLDTLDLISDGAFAVRDGVICAVGTSPEILSQYVGERVVDAANHLVSPAFSDPHTHLVHGGSRHEDWEDRVLERPARSIDSGIRSTLTHTSSATDEELTAHALGILDEMLVTGITAVEAKSGYGLSTEAELRLLEVTAALEHPVSVAPTYLGAHTVPARCADNREAYISEVIDALPAARALSSFCDVAIDPISFNTEEGERIIRAALAEGFQLRVHADQTADADGTRVAAQYGAITVDHLDFTNDTGLSALAESATIGVLFPAANMHLLDGVPSLAAPEKPLRNLPQWADRLVRSGAALALSTDYNPGTAPCTSMQEVMRLAMRIYRWPAARVWNMATVNAAHALGAGSSRGSIEVGKQADFIVWSAAAHGEVPYRIGGNQAVAVYIRGNLAAQHGSRASLAEAAAS